MSNVKFSFAKDLYNPADIGSAISYTDARKEYKRLQKIANERLAAMSRSAKWIRESETYKLNIGRYDTSVKELSNRQIAYQLTKVSDFLHAKTSSVYGLKQVRAKTLKTMHEHGYTKVTGFNFNRFVAIMEKMREEKLDTLYSSDEVMELFESQNDVEPDNLANALAEFYGQ